MAGPATARRLDARYSPGGNASAAFAGREAFAGSSEQPLRLCGFGSHSFGRGLTAAAERERDRFATPAHIARFPFCHDGTCSCPVCGEGQTDCAAVAANSLYFKSDRDLDYRGAGRGSKLLGPASAPNDALRRRDSRTAQRARAHSPGGGSWTDLERAGSAANFGQQRPAPGAFFIALAPVQPN